MSAVVVFVAWAALSLSCTDLVFGLTEAALVCTPTRAGELWLMRSRKDFTPI